MDRIFRINEEVRKAISDIIANDVKDSRLPMLTSITAVNVAKDLKVADVFFSVLGGEKERENAKAALQSAAGFIRRELSRKVQLRYTPELRFKEDRSIENGIYMSALIDKVIKQDEEKHGV